MRVDDPDIALYVKNIEESSSFYYVRDTNHSTIDTKKMLYVNL